MMTCTVKHVKLQMSMTSPLYMTFLGKKLTRPCVTDSGSIWFWTCRPIVPISLSRRSHWYQSRKNVQNRRPAETKALMRNSLVSKASTTRPPMLWAQGRSHHLLGQFATNRSPRQCSAFVPDVVIYQNRHSDVVLDTIILHQVSGQDILWPHTFHAGLLVATIGSNTQRCRCTQVVPKRKN